jgi:uncharacterized membrane protein
MKNLWIVLDIVSAFSSAMVVICDKMGTRYIDSTVVGIMQTTVSLLALLGIQLYFNNFSVLASVSRAASIDQFTITFILCLLVVFLKGTITWKSAIGSFYFWNKVLSIIDSIKFHMGFMVILSVLNFTASSWGSGHVLGNTGLSGRRSKKRLRKELMFIRNSHLTVMIER